MRRWKLVLVIGSLTVFVFWLALKIFNEPKSLLSRYKGQIEELKGEISDIEGSIDEYYSQKKGKKAERALFPFLDPVKTTTLKELIQEKLVLQERLAYQYNQIGDYYLNEQYLTDKNGPRKYQLYKKYGKELNYYLKKHKSLGNKILKMLIDTRVKALDHYNLATEAMDDLSSRFFRLKTKDPYVLSSTLKGSRLLKFKEYLGPIGLALSHRNNKRLIREYFSQRVHSQVHYKKGKCYLQLANLANLRDTHLTEQGKKVLNRNGRQKSYVLKAEKEFLISFGSDSRNTKVIYDLAELYIYRYEHVVENKSEFLLANSKKLISGFTETSDNKPPDDLMDFKGMAITVDFQTLFGKKSEEVHLTMSSSNTVKSLFLLAKIYYLMAYLGKDQYHRLQKWDDSFVGGLKAPKDLRLFYLNKVRSIYEHRLLAILPDVTGKKGKSQYEKAYDNYRRAKEEINQLSPGR